MICVVILDFDGVIAESLAVKTEAFRTLFSFAPDHLPEIIAFHRANGGMSRFEKIRYFYRHFLREELPEERFDELTRRYASLVVDGVIQAPLVAGAREFLEEYSAQIPLYIASATPVDEIRYIVQKRGLESFFREVYGSPLKKEEAIRTILDMEGSDPHTTVFIGDAVNDWKAARAAGVRFIGRQAPGEPDRLSSLEGVEAVLQDLRGLGAIVGRERC